MRNPILSALPAILACAAACTPEAPTAPVVPADGPSLELHQPFSDARVQAKRGVRVKLKRPATLLQGGHVVVVGVKVRCGPAFTVLESLLYVTQDGNQSQFASIPVRCSGKQEKFSVHVRAYEEMPLVRGPAHASAYVLVSVPGSEQTWSGSDSRQIKVR